MWRQLFEGLLLALAAFATWLATLAEWRVVVAHDITHPHFDPFAKEPWY
jgi:hypothetical protein